MQWNIIHKLVNTSAQKRRQEIIATVLTNRHIEDADQFLNPPHPRTLTPESVGIDVVMLDRGVKRIQAAIARHQPIIIFGDYDADGVTATAVLWETLHHLGATAYPFIPSRDRHGYGLSVLGITDAISSIKPSSSNLPPLIITVDNGIVAGEAALYCQNNQLDLIITDHHQPSVVIPPCLALVHTTALAGVGVSWMLAKTLAPQMADTSLDLVAIGTIADMLPLLGPNRSLVTHGLEALKHTKRPGLKALFAEAGIEISGGISTYHINYVLAPRLNAMGRLEHALDSLRVLLTQNQDKATALAHLLSDTNKTRQDLTKELVEQAQALVGDTTKQHVIVIDNDTFHEGVIGLVAGKLVETYSRPSIVICRGETVSKASVRSVTGVNIIEYLREFSQYFVNVGGHPMAAGFTIQTDQITAFKHAIQTQAKIAISPDKLISTLTVDCEILLDDISMDLFHDLEKLKPFGMGNREPVFVVKSARIIDMRLVGKTGDHVRLRFQAPSGTISTAIGFNLATKVSAESQFVNIAFTLEENSWNGTRSLQLHLKDIKA